MTSDAPRSATVRPRMQHVTTAGSALAVALVPLVVGVLFAKALAADPMTPVNALIAGGGQRAALPGASGSGAATTPCAGCARPAATRPAAAPAPAAAAPRGCLADQAGLAAPGTAPRRVVLSRRCSAWTPSSALRSTAPDAAP
ncbi:hypothetical protein WKI68_40710 [Streptomyces sp. MS1.HAVA.3]|uniref:Uncharacterized protein n=1 Tax=Streptomyces caledonius TaxID=3134107 RepID=A0ABU8UD88_9ACTN